MKNQEIITIAFLSMNGSIIISKATRNEDGTLKLVDYNYRNTNNSLVLNENSTEDIENCGVYGRFITVIENDTETQQQTENSTDMFVQPIEVEDVIFENEAAKIEIELTKMVDFVGEGYYKWNNV